MEEFSISLPRRKMSRRKLDIHDPIELVRVGMIARKDDEIADVPDEPKHIHGSEDMTPRELRECATRIVVAFLEKSEVSKGELALLVRETLHAISATDIGVHMTPIARAAAPTIAPQDDRYVTCFEDGKRMRSLRRHLREAHGLTPEEYRQKWNLPADFPLVAKDLSEKRSSLAQSTAFSQSRRKKARKPSSE